MKLRSKKIVAKRFKVTANGKILRLRQNARHLRRRKSKSQLRRLVKGVKVTGVMKRSIERFLPYA